ncbi:MAG: sugar ABC transporter ATP-binding protein [Clostridiales bacterium]|nr:sugar ABC transporter ATP-binding protein [Clostridiales bacterium]MDU3243079.1 sugar ABC transporter ATP-binding protein [Clostridiales bacterium]
MLELKNISKIFPGVKALDDVSLSFCKGEIHALMGENGAGKSTLMKIITGIYHPDMGEMYLDGEKADIKNFRDAVAHDINMVSQEIQVIPESTVAENIILDRIDQYKKRGMVDWKRINETAEKYLRIVGLDISPTQKIEHLTAAQKQLIQIAKALSSNAKYILLDEPTSSLTTYESNNLIKIVKRLKEQNVAVIFVSHKLEEVIALCDKVSVLRDGKYVGTKSCVGITRQDIVKMMIGREESNEHLGFLDVKEDVVLEAKNITTYGQFDHVGFQLKRGEILGFYGLVGSGRTELVRLLIGADKMDQGEVYVKGKKASINSVQDSLERYGIGYVSENRKEEGLILDFSVGTNTTITIWSRIRNKFKKISVKEEEKTIRYMIDKMKIKTPTAETKVGSLSGGNQQKVSIGKWLAADCDVLIIDEPTVGVDVGAKKYIHDLIWSLAKDEGKSIILISSDMPEMITLARRILVFKDQKITGEIDNLNAGERRYEDVSGEIGKLMA